MSGQDLIPHLFRTEFSRIVAVLAKQFGPEHFETAEDVASETFLSAIESWPYNGVPENPRAWLYAVAKNKTLNLLNRRGTFRERVAPALRDSPAEQNIPDLSERNITDSQLSMLFAVCDPSIPSESQIAMALRVLCGFGIDEIADALLTSKEAANKRLYRAKRSLRDAGIEIKMPSGSEIEERLDTVLRTVYLLFSEGYHSESNDEALRKELCHEAIRLGSLLVECEETNLPKTRALLALMYFHASRFDARTAAGRSLVLYEDQDPELWNREYIDTGARLLRSASEGELLSKYHLEASIAFWHTDRSDPKEKWTSILRLYDLLLNIETSPVAALNRIYAYAKVHGRKAGIAEALRLPETSKNRYFYSLLGDLYEGIDELKAKESFRKALELAKTENDRTAIAARLERLAGSL